MFPSCDKILKRIIERSLLEWKERKVRKPLVLLGARQVGKTWMMREFGKRHFAHVHEFNFDGNELLSELFAKTKRPQDLLPKLSAVSGRRRLFVHKCGSRVAA